MILSSLVAILRERTPLVGLVLLGIILRFSIPVVYRLVKRRLDRDLPDDLPLHAGDWLAEEVERRHLPVDVLVSPTSEEDVDAFLPSVRSIVLSQETYYKKDPPWTTRLTRLALVGCQLSLVVAFWRGVFAG